MNVVGRPQQSRFCPTPPPRPDVGASLPREGAEPPRNSNILVLCSPCSKVVSFLIRTVPVPNAWLNVTLSSLRLLDIEWEVWAGFR
jgi:hypothetical protein